MQTEPSSGSRIADVMRALVRPIVTLLFTIAAIVFTYIGIVSGDFFMGVATAVISYWFGQRGEEKSRIELK